MQARGRPLQSYDLKNFIVMLTDYDCSSKLCFEEKSNSVLFVKILKKKSPVDSFRCSQGFQGQMPYHATPTKSAENFIILAKNSKEKVKFNVALTQ